MYTHLKSLIEGAKQDYSIVLLDQYLFSIVNCTRYRLFLMIDYTCMFTLYFTYRLFFLFKLVSQFHYF